MPFSEPKRSKLDPNPRTRLQPQPPAPVEKPAPVIVEGRVPRPRRSKSAGQYLQLGAGYQIAHKPNSAWSVFNTLLAEHGHFDKIARALEGQRYTMTSLKDYATAKELLDKLMVSISKLEGLCRCHPVWKEHATKKTDVLKTRIKEGDKQAKDILGNKNRCESGTWTGNIPEIISTCVGYHSFLVYESARSDPRFKPFMDILDKPKKPNKNVKKFERAKVVFRRFPLHKNGDRAYVMLFPDKFVNEVKRAILTVYSIDEDEEFLRRLKAAKGHA